MALWLVMGMVGSSIVVAGVFIYFSCFYERKPAKIDSVVAMALLDLTNSPDGYWTLEALANEIREKGGKRLPEAQMTDLLEACQTQGLLASRWVMGSRGCCYQYALTATGERKIRSFINEGSH